MLIEVPWKRRIGSPSTAAQAAVQHGRSASGVDEFGVSYWNPGRFDQFWTQIARKAEAIDVDGYLEEKKLPMRFDDGMCE